VAVVDCTWVVDPRLVVDCIWVVDPRLVVDCIWVVERVAMYGTERQTETLAEVVFVSDFARTVFAVDFENFVHVGAVVEGEQLVVWLEVRNLVESSEAERG